MRKIARRNGWRRGENLMHMELKCCVDPLQLIIRSELTHLEIKQDLSLRIDSVKTALLKFTESYEQLINKKLEDFH